MTRQQLIAKLQKTWDDFRDSFSGLSDEQMTKPGVVESWSVKDIIAHVGWWEEESLNHLPEILHGICPQRYSVLYGGIDAFNALKTEQWRKLSFAEVQSRADQIHTNLIAYLASVPEEHFAAENNFRRRLRLDTYSHYPIHTQAIREWRAKNP